MNNKSISHFQRTKNFLGGGSSTLSKIYRTDDEPVIIEKGKGCRVWNCDGKEFIDYRNGLGPVTLGYSIKDINTAVAAQLKKGLVYGHPHRLEGEDAEKLCEVIPCAEKVRFLKTGGEAAAAAIKIARAYTGRDYVIHCGYNGWINSLATGGSVPIAIADKSPLRGVPSGIAHYHQMLSWNDYPAFEKCISESHEKIAAVIIATNYEHFYKGAEFLPAIRTLTEKYGICMIMDEIVTGFRIAFGGSGEYFNFKPDLAVFAKGMANGMPISIYAGRKELIDLSCDIGISTTYGGEALSLAAVCAVIDFYKKHEVIKCLRTSGEYLWPKMQTVLEKSNGKIKTAGHPACTQFLFKSPEIRNEFMSQCYRRGISFYDVSYVNHSHTKKDMDITLEAVAEAVNAMK